MSWVSSKDPGHRTATSLPPAGDHRKHLCFPLLSPVPQVSREEGGVRGMLGSCFSAETSGLCFGKGNLRQAWLHLFFWPYHVAFGILVPWPRIVAPEVKMKSPNHWTPGNFRVWLLFLLFNFCWSIVALQCSVSFCSTAKCISSKYTYVCAQSFGCVPLFATLRTIAFQAALSMGFSRQEYWSRLPFPSPGDLPDPGIEPRSPALQADALTSEPPGMHCVIYVFILILVSLH